jgi:hypothetical protein
VTGEAVREGRSAQDSRCTYSKRGIARIVPRNAGGTDTSTAAPPLPMLELRYILPVFSIGVPVRAAIAQSDGACAAVLIHPASQPARRMAGKCPCLAAGLVSVDWWGGMEWSRRAGPQTYEIPLPCSASHPQRGNRRLTAELSIVGGDFAARRASEQART